MPYPNEHSCRLESPDQFDRFARENDAREHKGKKIDVIYGIKDGKSRVQALRFPKSIWSESEARHYCAGKGSFEPALQNETSLNSKGLAHAKALIRAGKVDSTSSWSFSAADGNKILGDNDWSEYRKWFLGIDPTKDSETRQYYKYPFGKNGKVYRSAVRAIRTRAAQQGATEVFNAAGSLMDMLNKDLKFEFLKKDSAKQIVYGIVFEPDFEDAHGEYVAKEDIEEAAHLYMAKYQKVRRSHQELLKNAYIVESYIAPIDMDFRDLTIKEGTWIVAMKVEDDELWRQIESGEIKGFSAGGFKTFA